MRQATWSAGSKRGGRRPLRGFTLLELLVVLSIAALLLAVTPPLIANAIPGVQLKGAARSLAAALRQTRSRAISNSSPQHLTIDLEARELRMPWQSRSIDIPTAIDLQLTVAESQRIDAGQAMVRFFPDGSSTGGRIEMARAGSRYQVDIDWLTGKVTVVD